MLPDCVPPPRGAPHPASGVGPWQKNKDADVPSVWGQGTSRRVDVPGEGPPESLCPSGNTGSWLWEQDRTPASGLPWDASVGAQGKGRWC